jgi:hypothetical protein
MKQTTVFITVTLAVKGSIRNIDRNRSTKLTVLRWYNRHHTRPFAPAFAKKAKFYYNVPGRQSGAEGYLAGHRPWRKQYVFSIFVFPKIRRLSLKPKSTLSTKLATRYLLVIRNEENFEEKKTISFNYARLLVITTASLIILFSSSFYLSSTIWPGGFIPPAKR